MIFKINSSEVEYISYRFYIFLIYIYIFFFFITGGYKSSPGPSAITQTLSLFDMNSSGQSGSPPAPPFKPSLSSSLLTHLY